MRLTLDRGLAIVELGRRYRVASTLPAPIEASAAAFIEVDKDASIDDFERFASSVAARLGLSDAVVFATAARLPVSLHAELFEGESLRVYVVATVGLRPLVCTRVRLYKPRLGTINILVVVDEPGLRSNAAVELVSVAAAARASALHVTRPVCSNGRLTLGTVSDAIAVLYRPGRVVHAGPATTIGGVVADMVESIVLRAALAEGVDPAAVSEGFSRALESYGVVRQGV